MRRYSMLGAFLLMRAGSLLSKWKENYKFFGGRAWGDDDDPQMFYNEMKRLYNDIERYIKEPESRCDIEKMHMAKFSLMFCLCDYYRNHRFNILNFWELVTFVKKLLAESEEGRRESRRLLLDLLDDYSIVINYFMYFGMFEEAASLYEMLEGLDSESVTEEDLEEIRSSLEDMRSNKRCFSYEEAEDLTGHYAASVDDFKAGNWDKLFAATTEFYHLVVD